MSRCSVPNDIAQWGNATDRTGPVEVEGHGEWPPPGNFWNVPVTFEVNYRYANGVRLIYKTDKPYVKFEGEEGWIYTEFGGPQEAGPASILHSAIKENEIIFPFKSDKQDFIDAVKTRGQTLEDAEVGHRTTSLCHLAHIAIRVGKRLEWDPAKEKFTNSDEANVWVNKQMHEPKQV
jgi:hypothetical protein